MEHFGEMFAIPPRSRHATLEDVPGDIADGVIAYMQAIVSNVRGGVNIIIAGAVGAGKTSLAGLLLITYARLARTSDVAFIRAPELFGFLKDADPDLALPPHVAGPGLIKADILVIDDLGTELATSAAIRNWNGLIDKRYQAGRATIITTNSQDLDVIFHDERARSRFMAKCVTWRTERGDMRGVAETASTPNCEEKDEADPDEAEGEEEAACLPRPKTPEEWEDALAEIAGRRRANAADVAFLLADYGIPAVTTVVARTLDLPKIENVIRKVMATVHACEPTRHLLEAIAWRSHDHGFDYPEDFALLDWRERFADVPWSDQARARYGIPMPHAGEQGDGEG